MQKELLMVPRASFKSSKVFSRAFWKEWYVIQKKIAHGTPR